MKRYNPKDLEPKWQKTWADTKQYAAVDFDETRPKYVMLTEFPYPSGDGLHMGHVREYTLGDIMARHKRMNGYNVLYPMGYDAFGLPTENYAIKNKIAPQVATERNVANFQKQFESLGYSIDWDRSFRTTDPDYYKWTQWLFLQFFKANMAYQDEVAINWCPHCKTGLANEEVVNGRHERCDTLVEKKTLNQWMLRITDYADRLIDGLQHVDYPSRIADQQINWIGRSTGADITFKVADSDESITVFTTRADTIFSGAFLVLAPEYPLVAQITTPEHKQAVNTYIAATKGLTDIERQDANKEKSGVFTGAYAINPANDEELPIWIGDFVLAGYGTGAVFGDIHDDRDFEFLKKYDIPARTTVVPEYMDAEFPTKPDVKTVPRVAVQAIVKHPSEDKYLLLERHGWSQKSYSFVTGGIEEGEDILETATRELTEETGYKNVRSVEIIAPPYFTEFHHDVKKVNRRALVHNCLIQLEDLEQDEVAQEEKEIQSPVWMTLEEAEAKIHGEGCQKLLHDYQHGAEAYTGEGVLIDSAQFSGMRTEVARDQIIAWLAEKGAATERVNYRLRDWIFSRQHYWGEPIPIIHCEKHGAVPVPEDQLPVVLPDVENYEPTDTGESPLAEITEWVNTTCPECGGPAKRETDTMPNWAGSSWYYLRYYDAHNDTAFADPAKLKYWGEVDMYLGGMEHTTLHLLYSRFWHQFFYDQGLVPTPEPYHARRGQGIILATDGTKMSKSKGNVVNPTEIIDAGYGADALRLAITFLAPYDQTTPWSPETVGGTHRFINRVWTLTQEYLEAKPQADGSDEAILAGAHKAIKKVTEDLHVMNFNTSIAALMEFTNELYKIKAEKGFEAGQSWKFALQSLLQLLAPFAPHITEELWQELGNTDSVHISGWPEWDEKYLVQNSVTIVVQVNGKVRGQVVVPADASEEATVEAAKADAKVASYLEGQTIRKTIYVPGKLVSLVVG